VHKLETTGLFFESRKYEIPAKLFILGTRTEEMEKSVGIGLKLPSINFNPE
jgi:hypothetical protein